MRLRTPLTVLTLGLATALLFCQAAPAAKRIDLWKPPPPKPPAETTQGAEEPSEEAEEEAAEETRPAKILQQAALQYGLELVGEIVSVSAEDLELAPPDRTTVEEATKAEEEGGGQTEAARTEGPVSPLAPLPGYVTGEPFDDYALVAIGAGEFKHPQGQTLRAVLFEFATAQDAWGLWSVGRGDKSVVAGQAASWGGTLRVWKGQFAAVMSLEPADERLDEVRLTKLARGLFAKVPGRGASPEMVAWLPLGNQVAHTVTYFHANAPAAGDSLQLTPEAEAVSAIYEVGEAGYRAIIVRYPDREAALAAWKAFVGQVLGLDPSAGGPGGRRRAPVAGRWSGVRTVGRVGAFVLGAPSLHLTEVMLAQTCARAHD